MKNSPHSPLRRIHRFKRTHGLIETADLEPQILLFLHSIKWRRGVLLNHIAVVAGGAVVRQPYATFVSLPKQPSSEKSSCFAALKLHEISSKNQHPLSQFEECTKNASEKKSRDLESRIFCLYILYKLPNMSILQAILPWIIYVCLLQWLARPTKIPWNVWNSRATTKTYIQKTHEITVIQVLRRSPCCKQWHSQHSSTKAVARRVFPTEA